MPPNLLCSFGAQPPSHCIPKMTKFDSHLKLPLSTDADASEAQDDLVSNTEAQIADLSPQKMAGLYTQAEGFLLPMYRKYLAVE